MRRRRSRGPARVIKKNPHRTNREIRAPKVRLVGDNVGDADIVELDDAIKMAEEQELDLVEISPKADPPVCRILNYQKFLYDQKKKQKEIKANQAKVTQKEIRFGPNTDDHDFNFKVKHARKFLEEGNKLKAHVFFRGRSIVFKERGEILLLRFAQELEDVGTVELMPKLEGKRMFITLRPKK
ncbi:MAG: translation initiation factor IF-3 [Flavobacteriales bacterium]|nr:translation initiation factor IF-3 [Flavobacteriales bacterium]